MKKFLSIAFLALTLTTGFTCSKNAPEAQAPVATESQQAPAAAEAAPTEAPAEAPAEEAPAQ
jgi:hypothetical protein